MLQTVDTVVGDKRRISKGTQFDSVSQASIVEEASLNRQRGRTKTDVEPNHACCETYGC